MNFIPRYISVGDRVRLTIPMANRVGTFPAGHVFHVIDVAFRGDDRLYDLRDHDLNVLGDVSPAYLERIDDEDSD